VPNPYKTIREEHHNFEYERVELGGAADLANFQSGSFYLKIKQMMN
jgi:hypothetical protein